MCSEFTSRFYSADVGNLDFKIEFPADQQELDIRVRGYMKTELAPVIVASNSDQAMVKLMKFSLCPTWSKEFPCKFSTYNARMDRPAAKGVGAIERIYQVPTWREPFVQGQTCLVPMTSAIESSYFGLSAGKIIHFSQKNEAIYYVAGLWSQWIDKSTGEIHDTFTLITDHPYKFFFEHGHDRSVLVIDQTQHEEWLFNKKLKPEARFNLLRDNRISLDWEVKVDREMKSGWQKRAPSAQEIQSIQVWG